MAPSSAPSPASRRTPWRLALAGLAALACGAALGAFAWLFLNVTFFACDRLWNGLAWGAASSWPAHPATRWAGLPVLMGAVGGLAVGLSQTCLKGSAQPLPAIIGHLRSGRPEPWRASRIAPNLVAGMLPIMTGGAVGPFPALIAAVSDGWLRCRRRLKRCAGADPEGQLPQPERYALRGLALAGGVAGVVLGRLALRGIMVLPRFAAVHWAPGAFAKGLALGVGGCLVVLLFQVLCRLFTGLGTRLERFPLVKPLICGVALGLVSLILPYVLFSGSQQAATLMGWWAQVSGGALIATCLVKVACIALCLAFCWTGGAFFPLAFCGITLGYGCAALLGLDPMLCVTVVTCAVIGAYSRRPLLSLLLLLLIFPASSLPFIVFGLAVGLLVPLPGNPSYLARRKLKRQAAEKSRA